MVADCHTAQVTEWGPLSFVWDQAFFSIFIPLRGAQTIVSYFVLNAKTYRCLGRELGTYLTSKKSNFKEMFDRNRAQVLPRQEQLVRPTQQEALWAGDVLFCRGSGSGVQSLATVQ